MNKIKHFRLGKTAVIIGAVVIALLFISSATAVPQVHGSILITKLEEFQKEKAVKSLTTLLSQGMTTCTTDSNEAKLKSVYMLAVVSEQLIVTAENQESIIDISAIQRTTETILSEEIDEEALIIKTQECLNSLATIIDERLSSDDLLSKEIIALKILKKYILQMQSLVQNNAATMILSDTYDLEGFLRGILSIILIILSILFILIRGIIRGIIGAIGALIKLIVLIFAEIQGILIQTAFFVLYLGILSRIGLNLIAEAVAPIFAEIAFQLTLVIGSLLGNLVLLVSSLISLILIFAIPLIIILVILMLGEEEGVSAILATIIEAVFSMLISIPGLEEVLYQIWDWLGVRLPGWPGWPFESQPEKIITPVYC